MADEGATRKENQQGSTGAVDQEQHEGAPGDNTGDKQANGRNPEAPREAKQDARPGEARDEQNEEEERSDDLTKQIDEAVEAALAEHRDQMLRAQAEVQNMRRRCEADMEKAHKFALEKFSIELLPVMDNMERALQAVPDPSAESVKALCEGIELTIREFQDVLKKFNIEQINPEGEPFDPQHHEAISMVENKEVEPNSVVNVVQKGYLLNGRVIRPAMVVVAKG